MATYKQIQSYVQQKYGYQPKTCWIAHVKELSGLPVKKAWNRQGAGREVPCPPEKIPHLQEALRHFGVISN